MRRHKPETTLLHSDVRVKFAAHCLRFRGMRVAFSLQLTHTVCNVNDP